MRGQATAQVFAGRLPSDGKVAASREDSRWMADLIDFSKRRKQPGRHRYALVVVDVFKRFVWMEKLKDKTALLKPGSAKHTQALTAEKA